MLPPSLVDLTLARINTPSNIRHSRRNGARYLQSAALKLRSPPKSSPVYVPSRNNNSLKRRSKLEDGGLAVRSAARDSAKAISELSERVRALEQVALEHQAILEPPAYTEEQLLTIYEDLLSNPELPTQTSHSTAEEDQGQEENDQLLLSNLDERLKPSTSNSESLSSMLRRMAAGHRSQSQNEDGQQQAYMRILGRVEGLVSEMKEIRGPGVKPTISPGLLSFSEWEALMRTALHAEDPQSAQLALELMQETKLEATEEHVNTILEYFMERGDIVGFERSLKRNVRDTPTEDQRHLHIKTHLNSTSPTNIPASALSTLHAYENKATPPPQKTYSKLIHRLLTTPHSPVQAQAWDLFSHMRYVAHPIPDAIVYTQMIRSCASYYTVSRGAEPERAMDLWTEMTVDHGITPLSGTYNAVILACARSGRKAYIAEAFRLAKEMLDSNRDAYGLPAYLPDIQTFCALLEGAKRVGDLARARWILAEMIGEKQRGVSDVVVTEQVMRHVFHAYASYRVPFKRSMVTLVEQEAAEKEDKEEEEEEEEAVLSSEATSEDQKEHESANDSESEEHVVLPPVPEVRNPLFTHIPPQTHQEVINEAEILFARILEENGTKVNYETYDDASIPPLRFDNVGVTAYLLNSYLSVHYQHNSLENSRALFWKIFDDVGVRRSAKAFQEALGRCANTKKRSERKVALEFARELWNEWDTSKMEDASAARIIEKVHAAYIQTLSLTNNLDEAMTHLQLFVDRYPPSAIRTSRAPYKPDYRSSRVSLVGSRPLVRLSTDVEVPDDDVPPLLTFSDLKVLHHRLVSTGRREDIGFVKYICKSYEWALRVRRDEGMRAKPKVQEAERSEGLVDVLDAEA